MVKMSESKIKTSLEFSPEILGKIEILCEEKLYSDVKQFIEKAIAFKEANTERPDYPFLDKLREDYPNSATRLEQQIPQWKIQVDGISGITGLGDEILKTRF